MSSTQRASELQQLAAGSDSILDSSQLSAAAQRCSAQAEEAAQVASLARAEAARLAGHGPAPGNAAESPAPVPSRMGDPLADALPSDESALQLTSLPAAEAADTAAAAEAAVQVRLSAGADASVAEHPQFSGKSFDVIRGLSSDMQTAMQQLVSSVHSSSSAALPGAESGSRSSAQTPSWDIGVATEYGPGQGLPELHTSTLAASSSYQVPHSPDQASWQIPTAGTNPLLGLAIAAGVHTLPQQATGEGMEDQGPSGMQIHLMHQLDGLERSVRRVEQQVSSTKQTRRRLRTTSLPAQVKLNPILGRHPTASRSHAEQLK